MRVLVDTHTLLWAVDQPARLGAAAMAALRDPANSRLLSAATVWEVAIKIGLGKLSLGLAYRDWMNKAVKDLRLVVLPITVGYADAPAHLPLYHRDPFDRLLIAQAEVENVPVVTADAMFDVYGVTRIWD